MSGLRTAVVEKLTDENQTLGFFTDGVLGIDGASLDELKEKKMLRKGGSGRIKFSLGHGVNVDIPVKKVVMRAIENNCPRVIENLIDCDIDLRFENDSALVAAAKLGRMEIVDLLLKSGADVGAQENNALIQAVITGRLEMVKFLVSNGADVSAQNKLAFYLAKRLNHEDIIEFFDPRYKKSPIISYHTSSFKWRSPKSA